MYDAVIDAWIRDSLDLLAEFQFTAAGLEVLRRTRIELISVGELSNQRGLKIAIPVDLPAPLTPVEVRKIPFGQTALRIWNDINRPSAEWEAIPSDNPLWWRHVSGTLVPAWNLWANVRDLLTFREEREIADRDEHGRFPASSSPRSRLGALDVPVANDANAALLDAAIALEQGRPPALRIPEPFLKPPSIALSHDCDQLRGNDAITQAIRLYRALRETARGHPLQAARHLRAVAQNIISPRRFFAGNLIGMIDVERQFGFRSVSYFLTGEGGRLGARSGNESVRDFLPTIPDGWEVGVHYNYNTMGSASRLAEEMARLSATTGKAVVAGRAHYLRFDPIKNPSFLETMGIRYDESVGWAGHLSYRAGVAGPFSPFDLERRAPLSIVELPLTCMDWPLASAGFDNGFKRLFGHLQSVGGVMSILVHPGAFFNPEYPVYDGLYSKILSYVFNAGGRSWTPTQMLAHVGDWRRQPSFRPADASVD